jgi:hypothetical protein
VGVEGFVDHNSRVTYPQAFSNLGLYSHPEATRVVQWSLGSLLGVGDPCSDTVQNTNKPPKLGVGIGGVVYAAHAHQSLYLP